MKKFSSIKYQLLATTFSVMAVSSAFIQANDLALETEPMFLSGYADPNIIFTIDDSGSMEWEIMPDDLIYDSHYYLFPIPNNSDGSRGLSRCYNPLYEAGGCNYNDDVPYWFDNSLQNFFYRSAFRNKIFFDPTITYEPWKTATNEDWIW